MNRYIQAFQNYAKAYPVWSSGETVESLLDMLYQCYSEENLRETGETRAYWRQISDRTEAGGEEELFGLICQLCAIKEQNAFREGIRVGACLMLEMAEKTCRQASPEGAG